MRIFREIFSGPDDRLSSKRIVGVLAIGIAIYMDIRDSGTVDIRKALVWGGFAAIGVGLLETRVSQQ